jgi:acyl-CoA thioester hydrolase
MTEADPPDNEGVSFTWPVRVYWEDTDAGGVVYYANYLRFLERARTEWLRELGVEQTVLWERDGLVFVVRRVEADYLRPARYDDLLLVDCCLLELGRASLTMAQWVRRGGESLLAARVKLACVETTGFRPARIPVYLMERMADR